MDKTELKKAAAVFTALKRDISALEGLFKNMAINIADLALAVHRRDQGGPCCQCGQGKEQL